MSGVLKHIIKDFLMFCDYFSDYCKYRKFNYNNLSVCSKSALEAKIFRQTHTIEKGMSIERPRKGFGEKKIKELIDMLELYMKKEFSCLDTVFINAVNVMFRYVEFQRKLGYENKDLYKEINKYDKFYDESFECGVKEVTYVELQKEIHQEFPVFFDSRHSVRQFAAENIDYKSVEKAIDIAKKCPTACNRQAFRVYMYSQAEINAFIGEVVAGNTGFSDSVKNYLVITADMSAFYDSFERNQLYIEGGIFAMALIQALHYYGIASCILQNGEKKSSDKEIRKICNNIPQNEKIVLYIAIGYYKDKVTYAVSHRKSSSEIFINR